MPGRRWTDAELGRLCELAGTETAATIAHELGRSESAVYQRLAELRRSGEVVRRYSPWSAADDALLIEHDQAGIGLEALAAKLNRTPAAVSSRAIALRRSGIEVAKFAAPRPWSDAEDRLLEQAICGGSSDAQIAELLDRPIASVRARITKRAHELPQRRPRWTAERRANLIERRAAGATYRELANEFERDVSTIKRQLRASRNAS